MAMTLSSDAFRPGIIWGMRIPRGFYHVLLLTVLLALHWFGNQIPRRILVLILMANLAFLMCASLSRGIKLLAGRGMPTAEFADEADRTY
jgi:hypothetical protein